MEHMKNLAYFAIAAGLVFGLASLMAPPDISFRLEFHTSKTPPSR